MRFLPAAICLLAAATMPFLCRAQEGAGEYSISGVVVNSQTGEPVRQALVGGSGRREKSEAAPSRYQTIEPILTDASGAFHLRGLEAGTYTVHAEKPGFENEREKATPIKLGPSSEGVTIRLSPLGSISGRVLNGDGEPVPSVNVRALLSRIENGRRVVSQSRSVHTDDLGRYHLWNLAPGGYYIEAAGRSGGTAYYVGPSPIMVGAHEAFEPVFYPEAADWRSATPVTITPGASFEASLQVAMQPAFRVAGTIRGHDPAQIVHVEISRGDGSATAARANVAPGSGRFSIYDLVSGRYTIRAKQEGETRALYARQEVRIDGADVEGAALDMAPGAEVKVVLHGTPPKESEDEQAQRVRPRHYRAQGPNAFVRLIDPDGPDGSDHTAERAEDGGLTIPDVPQGRYRVLIHALGGYVASATAGGQDLLRGGLLTVAAGVDPPVVEVILRYDGGTITGTVAVEAAGRGSSVLLAPVEPGAEPLTARTLNGKFAFSNVAPGDYRAFLLSRADSVEYANAEALSALRGGESVHVTANGKAEVVLREVAE